MEEILHQLIGSISHYLQRFFTSQVLLAGFLNQYQLMYVDSAPLQTIQLWMVVWWLAGEGNDGGWCLRLTFCGKNPLFFPKLSPKNRCKVAMKKTLLFLFVYKGLY